MGVIIIDSELILLDPRKGVGRLRADGRYRWAYGKVAMMLLAEWDKLFSEWMAEVAP